MACAPALPLPTLTAQPGASVPYVTDEALAARFGVRIAFTGRAGGVSEGTYGSLNLGGHVGDCQDAVEENRARLLRELCAASAANPTGSAGVGALDAASAQLIVPNQVHGTNLVLVDGASETQLLGARAAVAAGADGVLVGVPNVAALLCFADCCPVILVAPSGRFAVVHAGWRGAVAGIAGKAARALSQMDAVASADAVVRGTALGDAAVYDATPGGIGQAAAGINAYIGPHIRSECFEVSEEVAAQFAERFGCACIPEERHVSLAAAVTADLLSAGMRPERIADVGICTKCHSEEYFSYRASGGVCGRHGAAAIRLEG